MRERTEKRGIEGGVRLETRTVDFVDVTSFVRRDVEFGEFAIESAVLVVATSNVSVERSKHLLTFVHLLLVVLNHDVTNHAKYTCTFETRHQYREEGEGLTACSS